MTTLKQQTSQAHIRVENHPFTKMLLASKLTIPQYCDFLYNQFPAYFKLENMCNARGLLIDLPGIERSTGIIEDIKFLRKLEPIVPELFNSTIEYLIHLDNLTDKQLLAHVYVRHMGDMYGGQMIKNLVPGNNNFYKFENRSMLIKQLRNKLTDDMAQEANVCFDYIYKLFDELAHEHNL
jgi:heme oxygenase